eukprot:762597-Hanusia_phi.AAC.1
MESGRAHQQTAAENRRQGRARGTFRREFDVTGHRIPRVLEVVVVSNIRCCTSAAGTLVPAPTYLDDSQLLEVTLHHVRQLCEPFLQPRSPRCCSPRISLSSKLACRSASA